MSDQRTDPAFPDGTPRFSQIRPVTVIGSQCDAARVPAKNGTNLSSPPPASGVSAVKVPRALASLLVAPAAIAALAVPAGASTAGIHWTKVKLPCRTGHKTATWVEKWSGNSARCSVRRTAHQGPPGGRHRPAPPRAVDHRRRGIGLVGAILPPPGIGGYWPWANSSLTGVLRRSRIGSEREWALRGATIVALLGHPRGLALRHIRERDRLWKGLTTCSRPRPVETKTD
jgi:hypothetical protein